MEEDTSEHSRADRIISPPKHLRGSVWKNFGFYTVNDQHLCIGLRWPTFSTVPECILCQTHSGHWSCCSAKMLLTLRLSCRRSVSAGRCFILSASALTVVSWSSLFMMLRQGQKKTEKGVAYYDYVRWGSTKLQLINKLNAKMQV